MEQFIGKHLVREEGDGVLFIAFCGNLTLVEIKQILARCEDVIRRYGRYGALLDIRRLDGIQPEARSYAGRWQGSHVCYGNAVFGGSGLGLLLVSLVLRAIQLFTAQQNASRFSRTEEEARIWLAAQRVKARAAPQPPQLPKL